MPTGPSSYSVCYAVYIHAETLYGTLKAQFMQACSNVLQCSEEVAQSKTR